MKKHLEGVPITSPEDLEALVEGARISVKVDPDSPFEEMTYIGGIEEGKLRVVGDMLEKGHSISQWETSTRNIQFSKEGLEFTQGTNYRVIPPGCADYKHIESFYS